MTNTKSHNFNLIKAQKYLDKLKSNIKDQGTNRKNTGPFHQIKTSVPIQQIFFSSTDTNDIENSFDKFVMQSKQETQLKLDMLRDLKNLKELVYSTNAKIGLSAILTQIDLLNEEKKIFENARTQCNNIMYDKNNMQKLFTNYSKAQENDDYNLVNAQIKLYSDQDLNEIIVDYTRKIEKLENERDKLNATTFVEFNFTFESSKILGI